MRPSNKRIKTEGYVQRGQMRPRPEDQERLYPRAEAEQEWYDRHEKMTFDYPDGQDHSESVGQAPFPEAPTNPEKPKVTVSFEAIRRMLSSR